MYYDHFGLSEAPFKITPNTDFFFSGGNRGPVLDALVYAITRGEGIVKVTGEVGSGKTMLCNMLQNRLPENVESVYLANPSVGPDEVLHAIAFELQLGLDRQADRLQVMHALQDYLLARYAEDRRVVVFIEESQGMPLATLEEIRLLSNLETRNDKLLQIVLFGQPELDENLKRSEIRQLRDRITHSFKLQPLTVEEAREYLTFRMRTAGYRGPELFSPRIVKQIAKASSGLTRRINLIADKALLAAFSENTHTVEARHIAAALRDSEFGQSEPWWRLSAWQKAPSAAMTLAVGVAVGAVTYALTDSRSHLAPASASTPASQTQDASSAATDSAGPRSDKAEDRLALRTAVVPGSAVTAVMDAPAQDGSRPAYAQGSSMGSARFASTSKAGAAPASANPGSNRGDLVLARMEATVDWLKSGDGSAYSIQLLVAEDERQLRKHLKTITKFIESNQIYLYRSAGRDRQLVSVLWGNFPDRKSAEHQIKELPASLRANRPYLRTVDGVRAEIEQLKGSSRR
jgi:type II secretory pathway predicted ATPase ExeA/septal ring-binding cell division protein DamX